MVAKPHARRAVPISARYRRTAMASGYILAAFDAGALMGGAVGSRPREAGLNPEYSMVRQQISKPIAREVTRMCRGRHQGRMYLALLLIYPLVDLKSGSATGCSCRLGVETPAQAAVL